MAKLLYAAVLLSALSTVTALPYTLEDTSETANVTAEDSSIFVKRELLRALPEKAAATELRYQPYLDFDTDGCYQTSAIDPSGKLNDGLQTKGQSVNSEGCREPPRLQNSNTYSRRRCNNKVCGIIYAYYFEKDSNGWGGGHTHDWEHIAVFTGVNDQLLGVAASQHGEWEIRKKGEYFTSKDGKRPIIVYHKDGVGATTHCFRYASRGDLENYENYTKNSFRAPLVGWLGWPSGLRDAVMNRNWGDAKIELKEDRFARALETAGARDYGLDPYGRDEQTT